MASRNGRAGGWLPGPELLATVVEFVVGFGGSLLVYLWSERDARVSPVFVGVGVVGAVCAVIGARR